ncbi:auxin response factor 16-like [Impatiens glandulifera]|uniref:auxin response factor 16-like n=1 Tax=Impatiens glandulifera TaxID=253017 RepID=UPI001FB108C2|nr:auxin response factor 16-like [Impatiens glandulifera]
MNKFQLWTALAGNLAKTIRKDQKVYFFPQGYQEQADRIVDFENIPSSIESSIKCKVLGVKYLANHETDEVYLKINLLPVPVNGSCSLDDDNDDDEDDEDDGDIHKLVAFAKTLTPSDANNGGGFSVPRYCADTMFPKLNFDDDPPVQNLRIKDVHGRIWTFRHIYRGSPRRHLFTTGWSGFVNNKKLISGDSIVFVKDNNGEIRVGLRRRINREASGDQTESSSAAAPPPPPRSRWNETKISPESVIESLNLASKGEAFEVVYYPQVNAPAFCVESLKVTKSLKIPWDAGSSCKIELESEDSSRKSWFDGTITSVEPFDPDHWKLSPWKSIKVKWDNDLENTLLEYVKFVSPWMIESVLSIIPQLINLSLSQPKKKSRYDHQPSLLTSSSSMFSGNLQQGVVPFNDYYCNVTPVGMQGAGQDPNGSLLSSSSSMVNYYNQFQTAGSYKILKSNFPKFNYHPGCVTIAAAGEVVADGKEEDENDSSHIYIFGTRIEKMKLDDESPSEEGMDDDVQGDGNGNESIEE